MCVARFFSIHKPQTYPFSFRKQLQMNSDGGIKKSKGHKSYLLREGETEHFDYCRKNYQMDYFLPYQILKLPR